jgi:hypothetical protein
MNAHSPYRDEPDREASRRSANELETKITRTLKLGVPIATVSFAGVAGAVQGPSTAILILAGGALVGVIAVFWASVRTLLGETPLSGADAYALGAPRAEEEQKRAVLRALKDLEFERSVGKISEEDYQALVAKYRAEAKRLLRLLDAEAQPRREHVESLVNKRLRREGLLGDERAPEADKTASPAETGGLDGAPAAEAAEPVADQAPARTKKRRKARAAAQAAASQVEGTSHDLGEQQAKEGDSADHADAATERTCAACGTLNDVDAVFCKKCGTRRATSEAATREAPVEAPVPSEEEEAS